MLLKKRGRRSGAKMRFSDKKAYLFRETGLQLADAGIYYRDIDPHSEADSVLFFSSPIYKPDGTRPRPVTRSYP